LALDAFKNDKDTISPLIKKFATPVKKDSAFMPVRQTSIPLMKRKDGGRIRRLFGMWHLPDRLYLRSVKWEYPRSGFGVQYRFG